MIRAGGRRIKTCELEYDLPQRLIAQRPCAPRDAARMLVLRRSDGTLTDATFRDLPGLLRPRDCLVVNTTRVIPARFIARRATGGRIEGLFVREPSPGIWIAMVQGTARLEPGEKLALDGAAHALTLVRRGEEGLCEFAVTPPDAAAAVLESAGATPLPPYIRRPRDRVVEQERCDRREYQTVYAHAPGAIAAPTAGMHFTESLLERIKTDGVTVAAVVLHVGLGTFKPVTVEDLADHVMHREYYELPDATVRSIERARAGGGRVVAVGTTVVRVLETCARAGELRAGAGWTDLMIRSPFEFRATDALITNFHLPRSTLLALVCAFAGREATLAAYRHAVAREYRFYSYGDAMFIN